MVCEHKTVIMIDGTFEDVEFRWSDGVVEKSLPGLQGVGENKTVRIDICVECGRVVGFSGEDYNFMFNKRVI